MSTLKIVNVKIPNVYDTPRILHNAMFLKEQNIIIDFHQITNGVQIMYINDPTKTHNVDLLFK